MCYSSNRELMQSPFPFFPAKWPVISIFPNYISVFASLNVANIPLPLYFPISLLEPQAEEAGCLFSSERDVSYFCGVTYITVSLFSLISLHYPGAATVLHPPYHSPTLKLFMLVHKEERDSVEESATNHIPVEINSAQD